ncbi:hypothetical protein KL918_002654 [Ogataea parapolymorpha]|uniref:Reduced viability upon starvation protein 167 n=1 Tax=Ogataea parapolymorpha (strain ATCC 26012 / BCRC 20466 / JCM 22074 / NRRL Y-7560 / DL-1) TaxID=871575 RepID=W1QG11_OGAPD|nr:Reduced viability upon starvation protein 167 [Ogataea parapolymorpha DL-1]ESX01012.1 Reduced viability upon starvation protein 167 [Ogataea parapolymorpha DL-1]KAG7867215.1 hypothetical protein KL918_002654 [Ogataea parapolymorpha]KAG7870757.1 hypothetical protein KL916_004646 [Ogataea parapolymorpha]
MSFKGFQKAIVRAPQNLRQKLNMGETTNDPVYQDAERRFRELEDMTKRLSEESKRYHKAVNDMLDRQLGFSKSIEEIFKPISGKVSDPNSTIPEGNPEGIEACVQYRDVLQELKETLKPDLELIESRIVGPANELLRIIQAIRKMATKRNHKQLDLDRHQNSLKKAQLKAEKNEKMEEKVYKYENDVAIAQQEFDYYNEMLKTELPILFQLEGEFIKPLFVSLYYMQLNVFYTLSSRMEEMKIPYFDLNSDILEQFANKRGDVEERAEAIGLTHFKIGHAKAKLEATKRRYASGQHPDPSSPTSSYGSGSAYGQTSPLTAYGQTSPPPYGQNSPTPAYGQTYGQTPPTTTSTYGYPEDKKTPYGAPQAASYAYSSPNSYTSASSPVVPPAPAAAPAAAAPAAETCTALYDYTAQAEGDLSFSAGQVITILQRSENQNDWWTGSVNGVTGVFPGNYVQLN